jgi:hypothetical protein
MVYGEAQLYGRLQPADKDCGARSLRAKPGEHCRDRERKAGTGERRQSFTAFGQRMSSLMQQNKFNASASIQTEATSRSLIKLMHNKELGRWRMNEVNASVR